MYNEKSSRQRPNQRPLPEVAEPQPDQSQRDSDALGDVAAFKVFLKRNLRHQAPPADLLGKLRGRIAKIKAED